MEIRGNVMKRLISVLLILILAFSLSSCKNKKYIKDDEQIASKVSEGSLGELACYYSVDNSDRTDNEFLVHFPSDVYDSKKDNFYDENAETLIQFTGKKVFYDKNTGKKIDEEDLEYGQLLKVVYDGKTYGKNPIKIKAVKVYVCD